MNDAQIWTMIGAFTALMFGMMTVISALFIRVLRAEIGGLRGEMNGQIGGLRGEMNSRIDDLRNEMNGQIGGLRGEMNARFDGMESRFEGLDREVHALVKHTFGFDRD